MIQSVRKLFVILKSLILNFVEMEELKNLYSVREINDGVEWDNVARLFPSATIFNCWGWVRFERAMGSDHHAFAVFKGERMIGLAPVKFISGRRGKSLHLLYSPLIDWNDKDTTSFLVGFLKNMAKEKGAILIRFTPLIPLSKENEQMLDKLGTIRATSYDTELDRSIHLDLAMDEKDILMQMRKSTRYSIKQAEKLGVRVRVGESDADLKDFWEIFVDSALRNSWSEHYSFKHIENQFKIFRERGEAKIFFSEYNREPIAAGIFMFFNGWVSYVHSGTMTKYREIPAMHLMMWELIKYSKEIGMKKVSLWGVCDKDKKNHPWYGLSTFKRGFGGDEVRHVHARDIIVSPFAHLTRTYERVENKLMNLS